MGERHSGPVSAPLYRYSDGGRAWLNSREVGAADPRYTHLEASHD